MAHGINNKYRYVKINASCNYCRAANVVCKQWSVPRNHYIGRMEQQRGFIKKNSQKSQIDFRKEEWLYC